jgi:hypothetical protein
MDGGAAGQSLTAFQSENVSGGPVSHAGFRCGLYAATIFGETSRGSTALPT